MEEEKERAAGPMAPFDPQLLMSLMDTVPDRIYFKDRAGRFLFMNQAMRAFLRVGREEDITGRTDFDFFLPAHAQPAFDDEQHILATGESIIGKLEREDLPDGRVTWVSTTKVPMSDATGHIIGTCGISREVTEEHEKTEKLNEYAAVLAEKQAQIEEELALARQVQQALLPQAYPTFPREAMPGESALRFSHRYLPEGIVGGDFFTIIRVSDTQAGVLVCDVMGHGVHAALVTAVERVLIEEVQAMAGDPGLFLRELNARLHHFFEPLPTAMFVTALYMVIDTVTGRVRFANAGHPDPLHISRARHEVRPLGSHLLRHPFALGVVGDSVYSTQEDVVAPGDLLFLYTDGLCDLGEGRDMMPDSPEFLGLVKSCITQRNEGFLDAVLERAREIMASDHFADDVCLVGVEIQRLGEEPMGGSFTD
jgi:sigma-B regulation protein RsbU (phosphoserine phosphatase)